MSIDGIVVSDLAGRLVDGAIASLDVLEKIVNVNLFRIYLKVHMLNCAVYQREDQINRDIINSLPNSAVMIDEKSKL